jgi:hypothetical protein
MPTKKLGPAHRSLMTAANDQYHGVASINEYGEISHAHALAQVLLDSGEATTQAQAVQLAACELIHVIRIARGEMINRKARKLLVAKAQQGQAPAFHAFAPHADRGPELT